MRHVAVITALVVLSACGSDDGSEPEAADTTTTTLLAVGEDESATPTTAPATTAPDTTTATTPAPPTTAEGNDPCLVGSWVMKQDSLDLMAATAVPFAGIQIPSGGMTLTFGDDGTVATDAKFTAVFTMADTPAEADVFWAHSGTWTTDDDVVLMEFTSQESGITEVRQGGISMGGFPMDPIAPVNGGPYTCSEHQLLITATNGSIEIPMNFER